ncbi:hypothetical protein D039_2293B, partial [Vibrio parahaemolyticus EKP-028]
IFHRLMRLSIHHIGK